MVNKYGGVKLLNLSIQDYVIDYNIADTVI